MSAESEFDVPFRSARARPSRRAGQRWYQVLALALAVLLTPSVNAVVQDVLAFWTGVECCEDGECSGKGGVSCDHACAHCSCCAHPVALPAAAGLIAVAEAPAGDALVARRRELVRSGYRAPPFRPPAI